MNIVIVGSRSRDESKDKPLVDAIIDEVKELYGQVLIVTKSGDKGVGKLIFERCTKDGLREFNMAEYTVRHVLQHELPRHQFLRHFNFLNAALVEIGDEFHILTENYPTGDMKDLVDRVKQSEQLSLAIYYPGDPNKAKKAERRVSV